ncbi:MAG: hypothetical protein ACI837_002394 [Crocinitomicaceae bacterium]|jgi:hypothetical protein
MKKTLLILISIAGAFCFGYFFKTIFSSEVESPKDEKVQIAKEPVADEEKKVIGVGGIFFNSTESEELNQWYSDNLGFDIGPHGCRFVWDQVSGDSTIEGSVQWSVFETTEYFEPSTKDFMINYRVENLERLVAQLKEDSIELLSEIMIYPYGKFVHLMDIDGNKVELFEPNYSYVPEAQ